MHVDHTRTNLHTVANADTYSNTHARFGAQSNANLCTDIHTHTTRGDRHNES